MLYSYDVEKARQLMTEAGYPDGFKTKIVCAGVPSTVDYLSIIVAYLQEIDIELEIVPMESSAFTGYLFGKNQKPGEMMCSTAVLAPDTPLAVNPVVPFNFAFIKDPYYNRIFEAQGRAIVTDPTYWAQIIKEMNVYQLASAWGIWKPMPYTYNLWWPWVEGYHGMTMTGWARESEFNKMLWVDTELKKALGY